MKKSPVASRQSPAEHYRDDLVGRREAWLTNVWFRMKSHGEPENREPGTGDWELETGNWKLPWE